MAIVTGVVCLVAIVFGVVWNARTPTIAPSPQPQEVTPLPQALTPLPQAVTPLPTNLPEKTAAVCREYVPIQQRAVTQRDIDELRGNTCIYKLSLFEAKVTDEQMLQISAAVPSLRSLELAGSKGLSARGYAAIANIAALEILDLADTSFGDDDLARLSGLPALEELSLRRTQVTDLSAPFLANLQTLERLWLDEDDVGDDMAGGIAALEQLWQAGLTKTHLSDVGLARLTKSLPNLKFLEIGGTAVTGDGLRAVKSVPGLLGLGLDDLPVRGDDLVVVENLPNLFWLDVSRTQVTSGDLVHLRGLSNMERLFLNGIAVTDADMALVSELVNIVELEVRNTAVTDAGVAVLSKMPHLAFFDLGNNGGITDRSIAPLVAAPELRIVNVHGTKITVHGDRGKLTFVSY